MTKKELMEAIEDYPDTCEITIMKSSFENYHYRVSLYPVDTIKRDKGIIYLEIKV
jgi:hypothetical protein